MGLFWTKRVRLFPGFRMNLTLSRRGLTIGGSAGAPGARISVNNRKEAQVSAGVPGTGVRYVKRGKVK